MFAFILPRKHEENVAEVHGANAATPPTFWVFDTSQAIITED
jgi:hypothetical protein